MAQTSSFGTLLYPFTSLDIHNMFTRQKIETNASIIAEQTKSKIICEALIVIIALIWCSIHITFTIKTYRYKNQCHNIFTSKLIAYLIIVFIIDYTSLLIFNIFSSTVICANVYFNCFIFIVLTVIANASLYLSLNNHQVCDNCINHTVFKREILIGVIALILISNGLILCSVHIYQIHLDLYFVERKTQSPIIFTYRIRFYLITISMIGHALTSVFGAIHSAAIDTNVYFNCFVFTVLTVCLWNIDQSSILNDYINVIYYLMVIERRHLASKCKYIFNIKSICLDSLLFIANNHDNMP